MMASHPRPRSNLSCADFWFCVLVGWMIAVFYLITVQSSRQLYLARRIGDELESMLAEPAVDDKRENLVITLDIVQTQNFIQTEKVHRRRKRLSDSTALKHIEKPMDYLCFHPMKSIAYCVNMTKDSKQNLIVSLKLINNINEQDIENNDEMESSGLAQETTRNTPSDSRNLESESGFRIYFNNEQNTFTASEETEKASSKKKEEDTPIYSSFFQTDLETRYKTAYIHSKLSEANLATLNKTPYQRDESSNEIVLEDKAKTDTMEKMIEMENTIKPVAHNSLRIRRDSSNEDIEEYGKSIEDMEEEEAILAFMESGIRGRPRNTKVRPNSIERLYTKKYFKNSSPDTYEEQMIIPHRNQVDKIDTMKTEMEESSKQNYKVHSSRMTESSNKSPHDLMEETFGNNEKNFKDYEYDRQRELLDKLLDNGKRKTEIQATTIRERHNKDYLNSVNVENLVQCSKNKPQANKQPDSSRNMNKDERDNIDVYVKEKSDKGKARIKVILEVKSNAEKDHSYRGSEGHIIHEGHGKKEKQVTGVSKFQQSKIQDIKQRNYLDSIDDEIGRTDISSNSSSNYKNERYTKSKIDEEIINLPKKEVVEPIKNIYSLLSYILSLIKNLEQIESKPRKISKKA